MILSIEQVRNLISNARTNLLNDRFCCFYKLITDSYTPCSICEVNMPEEEDYCANTKVRLMLK